MGLSSFACFGMRREEEESWDFQVLWYVVFEAAAGV
jgi:hypothetical protein